MDLDLDYMDLDMDFESAAQPGSLWGAWLENNVYISFV